MKGVWFDVYCWEGEDPDSVINVDDCNGYVYSASDVNTIVHDITKLVFSAKELDIDQATVRALSELSFKLSAGYGKLT